jgi:hypothetical protein
MERKYDRLDKLWELEENTGDRGDKNAKLYGASEDNCL